MGAGKGNRSQLLRNTRWLALFLFGKCRKAQRFLYNSRPQSTGAEEKETE
nr:MAG TPA: hypothetical protein [Caudoviricetes sp.]